MDLIAPPSLPATLWNPYFVMRNPLGTASLGTVVLAAGAGTRFGGPKQLAEIDRRPVLRRVLDALDGVAAEQVVVLGARAEAVGAVVPADRWRLVTAPDWEAGMGASLRAGIATLPTVEAVLVVLGDLAWLRREAVERILAAAAGSGAEAVRAFDRGQPGHPVLLRGTLLEAARSAPDAGLGATLSRAEVLAVDCTGLGVARDVDRREDLPAVIDADR